MLLCPGDGSADSHPFVPPDALSALLPAGVWRSPFQPPWFSALCVDLAMGATSTRLEPGGGWQLVRLDIPWLLPCLLFGGGGGGGWLLFFMKPT